MDLPEIAEDSSHGFVVPDLGLAGSKASLASVVLSAGIADGFAGIAEDSSHGFVVPD